MKIELKEFIQNKNKESKGIFSIIFIVFSIALIALIVVLTLNKIEYRKYIGQEFEIRNTITISGQGEVFAKPDLAIVNFSVISEKETADKAIEENVERMNAIIVFMKENKVEDRDLRTIDFRISPRYEWQDENGWDRRRVLVGYEVRQSLEVRIRDMEKIGLIIRGATDLGANRVERLRFTIDNKEGLKAQAREKAIRQGKEKAKILADQLDIELIRIVDFSEGHPAIIPYFGDILFPMAPREEFVPRIEIGEDKVQVIVHITYEIK